VRISAPVRRSWTCRGYLSSSVRCRSAYVSRGHMALDPATLKRTRDIGLFSGLGDDVLSSFVGEVQLVEIDAGIVVFREGESGRELWVVLDGEVEVLRRSKRGHETRVAVLGPGDWFGEMSVLDVLPRSATTRLLAPSRLIRLTAHDLDGLYRR